MMSFFELFGETGQACIRPTPRLPAVEEYDPAASATKHLPAEEDSTSSGRKGMHRTPCGAPTEELLSGLYPKGYCTP